MPITDVSLLALVDEPMLFAPLVKATIPDLYESFQAATVATPGLHVTLHEFLVAPGHAKLQAALDWCEQSGAALVAHVTRLGMARFAARTLIRSRRGATLMLSSESSDGWLCAVDTACSRITAPLFARRPGRPERLHLTLARSPELDLREGAVEHHRVDVVIDLNRFCLALATALPYGQIRWLTTSGRLEVADRCGENANRGDGQATPPRTP